jgi:prepilin-type N-terminal cleavage/methylation domain-containing protein
VLGAPIATNGAMAPPLDHNHRRGFTLLEVMVALGLLVGAVLAVAQLLIAAAGGAQWSRATTVATAAAAQKLEQLRSLACGYTVEGAPVDQLAPSPPGALAADTAGFVDYLDDAGVTVGSGLSPPAQARFTRRWSVEADDESVPPGRMVLTVVVLRQAASSGRSSSGPTSWVEAIRLVGVRTRRPS